MSVQTVTTLYYVAPFPSSAVFFVCDRREEDDEDPDLETYKPLKRSASVNPSFRESNFLP